MSGSTTTRAARSPRATTPKDGRPWYAPRPRWYVLADGLGAQLMRRERVPYNVRHDAGCASLYTAEQLAAALNREERARARRLHEIALRDTALAKLGDVRHALRELVDAAARVPTLRDGGCFARAVEAARRVLGDEPAFAPGGEPRGLKPAAQNRQRAARRTGDGRDAR